MFGINLPLTEPLFGCIVFVLLSVGISTAIQFKIDPMAEKCIQLDVAKDSVVQANFSVTPFLNEGKLFVKVFYRDFEERSIQVTSSSTQDKKSLAFIAEEDAFFSFCFQDRPRTGWIISEDRFITFTWKIAHEEVDTMSAIWDVDRKLAPLERTLEAIDLEAQEMVVEINHRKQIHGELRATMETMDRRFWRLAFSFIITLIGTAVVQVRCTLSFLKKKKVL